MEQEKGGIKMLYYLKMGQTTILKFVLAVLLGLYGAGLFYPIPLNAAPSNSISVPNDFVPHTTAISSDVDENLNEIQNKFNTHTHTDITQFGTLSSVDIDGGTLDGVTLGGSSAVTLTNLTASANLDIGSYGLTALTFTSDQATGTAPLTVASTTVVTNLNADKVDGYDITDDKIINGWVDYNQVTNTVNDSYNVTSVTDDAVGEFIVTWDSDFATAYYAVVATAYRDEAGDVCNVAAKAAGSVEIYGEDAIGDRGDNAGNYVIAVGNR